MGKGRLLLIEDEKSLATPIKKGLQEEGYLVDHSDNGEQGLLMALTTPYDVLILDWRLPGMDGITVLNRIRGSKSKLPVLMLTAMQEVEYRVKGLNAGADDYLTKPFSFEELLARIKALKRRHQADTIPLEHEQVRLKAGILEMDIVRRTASLAGESLVLRMKEFQLLELFMRRVDEIVTRTMIAEQVWGSAFDVTDNAIDVTISNLRQHLASGLDDIEIETMRGLGYRLSVLTEKGDDS